MRKLLLIAGVWLAFITVARCEEPLRLKVQPGDTLKYRVLHTTQIKETTIDEESKKPIEVVKSSKMQMIKAWTVKLIDSKGLITLDLTIHRMRLEQTQPDGKTDLFDSDQPDELNKETIAQTVGPVLATIKINDRGDVVEVIKSPGPKHRTLAELPFKVMFPEAAVNDWQRTCTIQLDPPQGLGDRHASLQSFSLNGQRKEGTAVVGLKTTLKETPADASELTHLIPFLWEGSIQVLPSNGHVVEMNLKIGKEIKNHQGNGSTYHYEASYQEEMMSK